MELLGISPLNRGRLGVSSYHVHEVARPGLSAATYARTDVLRWAQAGARLTEPTCLTDLRKLRTHVRRRAASCGVHHAKIDVSFICYRTMSCGCSDSEGSSGNHTLHGAGGGESESWGSSTVQRYVVFNEARRMLCRRMLSHAIAFAAEVRSERRLGQVQIQGRHGGGSAGPPNVIWCISVCTFSVCGTWFART